MTSMVNTRAGSARKRPGVVDGVAELAFDADDPVDGADRRPDDIQHALTLDFARRSHHFVGHLHPHEGRVGPEVASQDIRRLIRGTRQFAW